jgi:hypothetical protein
MHPLAIKARGGTKQKRRRRTEGKREQMEKERGKVTVGRKKGGERAAPALPTPSCSAHHLLRPAATAITHHKRTSTAQRRGEKERDRGNERRERRTEERTQWEIQETQRKPHEDIETEEQRNSSRRNRTAKPKRKDSRGG